MLDTKSFSLPEFINHVQRKDKGETKVSFLHFALDPICKDDLDDLCLLFKVNFM